jgi:hypothetical protein
MKYIICDNPEHFTLGSKEPPSLSKGNALLKVKRVGICGTDLHAFKGNQPFFSYPRILGHELATEVMEINQNSNGLKSGDKVVMVPYMNCEQCVACQAGKPNCCQNIKVFGVHVDGGMQEVISFPTRLLIPANDLSFDEIAIVEPLAIGAHALQRANIKKNEIVVILGCGPIGMGLIQLAKFMGSTVIAIDINDHRIQLAKESFGADLALQASDSSIEKLKQFTGGDLAHTVIDATGSKAAIETATQYMRHGGNFVLVGLYKGDLVFQHPAIHAKETTLLCSRNATPEDFEFVMKVLREKKFNTQAYVTRSVKFETILSEFHSWTSPTSSEIKVMTEWD